jgi:hypothetical protein
MRCFLWIAQEEAALSWRDVCSYVGISDGSAHPMKVAGIQTIYTKLRRQAAADEIPQRPRHVVPVDKINSGENFAERLPGYVLVDAATFGLRRSA